MNGTPVLVNDVMTHRVVALRAGAAFKDREGHARVAGQRPPCAGRPRARRRSLIPLAARLARAVAGVVDVRCALTGPPRRPDLDPDLPDDDSAPTP